MRAISVGCPNCGAALQVDGNATSVVCPYCNTPSRVQQRSRIWQVPQRLPPTTGVDPTRVARQRIGWLIALPILITVGAVVIPIVCVVVQVTRSPLKTITTITRTTQHTTQRTLPRHGPDPKHMTWSGDPAILADVDGDGADDLIGITRYLHDDDRLKVGAFSGKTGAKLWETEQAGSHQELNQARLAAVGDAVIMTLPTGAVRGYDLKTGATRWETQVGEKVEELCRGETDAEVAVATADERWHRIGLADGQRRDGPALSVPQRRSKRDSPMRRFAGQAPANACVVLDTSQRDVMAGLRTVDSWSNLPDVTGMRVERLIRRGDGPVFAVGNKTPGTSVPMLARLDGKKLVWKVMVPSADPLNSRGEDTLVTITDEGVFAIYEPPTGPPHLTGFALEDGRRLWDQEVQKGTTIVMTGLAAAGSNLVMSAWGHLQAFDQATGKPVFMLGDP